MKSFFRTAVWAVGGAIVWLALQRVFSPLPELSPPAAQRDADDTRSVTATRQARPPAGSPALGTAPDKPYPTPGNGAAISDEARDYLELRDFQQRLRTRLASSEQSQPGDSLLQDEIDRREAAGELLPLEALMLRLGFLRLNSPDDYQHEATALLDAYQAQREARRASFSPTSDPRFQDYKRLEAAIVREAMKRSRFPGDQSRDEYLRTRLQALREQIYSEH